MGFFRNSPTETPSLSAWNAFRSKFNVNSVGRRRAYLNRSFLTLALLSIISGIVLAIWLSLVSVFIYRLKPRGPQNGLLTIIENWKGPESLIAGPHSWLDDFSRDIHPIPCHSHNDYKRRVPLFEALYAGCISVEADIWLNNVATDILVGHTKMSLRPDRTLQSLYLNPLMTILTKQNLQSEVKVKASPHNTVVGVFDNNPKTSLTLLLDMKTSSTVLWPLLQKQLEAFREEDWLSYWDGYNQCFVSRPLTVVATGNAPFDIIEANETYRDIFYDAPLHDIKNPKYTAANSYYASTSLQASVGWPVAGRFSTRQIRSIKKHISSAKEKGLKARYWNTPNWPSSVRNRVWGLLIQSGIGVLNVDNLVEVSRWNWDLCTVAGLILCGLS